MRIAGAVLLILMGVSFIITPHIFLQEKLISSFNDSFVKGIERSESYFKTRSVQDINVKQEYEQRLVEHKEDVAVFKKELIDKKTTTTAAIYILIRLVGIIYLITGIVFMMNLKETFLMMVLAGSSYLLFIFLFNNYYDAISENFLRTFKSGLRVDVSLGVLKKEMYLAMVKESVDEVVIQRIKHIAMVTVIYLAIPGIYLAKCSLNIMRSKGVVR